ncbi:MAG: hypothetical protein AVDCRST_MAG50-2825 [uncultured Acidimicrobiales bacterium]|uniref:Methyltransferase type 11 domain-containing protein n=1 Tax=uncultured Acidimicrobiales bacterium TaxID=310071 RepID=A0A6J4IYG2_9ACTN|nr:MAG: hypothetical protein AVDCRST_MAG50-2825 [uncultured Acidimicrobiales bacterium]
MDSGPDPTAVERALATYYDQEAGDRAGRALDPKRVAARTEFLQLLDGRRPRLLEVGTGPGRDLAAFVAAGLPVTGIDLSIEHAARAADVGAGTAVASARALPFHDKAFDALWTMSTLMHVPNSAIEATLAELGRVLTSGALAVIGVWGGPDVEDHHDHDAYQPPRLFSRRSDDRWQSLLGILGSVEQFETWDRSDQAFWYQWAVVRAS